MKDIKAALVTGGATGIGKACALSFLEGGYAVAIVGRRKEKIEETEKELADIFGNEKVLAIAADVSSREDVEKIFASIDEKYGRIDVVINNAGVAPSHPFLETSYEEYDKDQSVRDVYVHAERRQDDGGKRHIRRHNKYGKHIRKSSQRQHNRLQCQQGSR